jgi:hypothetical protein
MFFGLSAPYVPVSVPSHDSVIILGSFSAVAGAYCPAIDRRMNRTALIRRMGLAVGVVSEVSDPLSALLLKYQCSPINKPARRFPAALVRRGHRRLLRREGQRVMVANHFL